MRFSKINSYLKTYLIYRISLRNYIINRKTCQYLENLNFKHFHWYQAAHTMRHITYFHNTFSLHIGTSNKRCIEVSSGTCITQYEVGCSNVNTIILNIVQFRIRRGKHSFKSFIHWTLIFFSIKCSYSRGWNQNILHTITNQ